ncbi:hypothetical protein BH11CYA1_BH11CYA1_15450 [soil metagenome]
MAMEKADRRDSVALDKAYEFYRETLSEGTNDLHQVANSLKTVCHAINAAESGELELTLRLWQKIRQALFDKLLTNFSAYIVATGSDGQVLGHRELLPDDCTLELHPEGLRRDDDVFSIGIEELHPLTRSRLDKVWLERGPGTRREDFSNASECEGGVCTMKPHTFIVGEEVLKTEANTGRQKAYDNYWRLYWQSYCSPSSREKQYLTRQMTSLEAVWGNLHY